MADPVNVRLGARSYPVHVGAGLLGKLPELIPARFRGKRCAVVTDSNVGPLYGNAVLASLAYAGVEARLVTIPAGESSKSLACVETVCDRMAAAGLDRSSVVVALGGGVPGDLAGFVASVFYRGIPFIQIPTTVVAQVDSAVGGKTGVNLRGGKNLVGSFHQPALVVADVATLDTLPQREFDEGFAEIVKHAIIRDRALFDSLETFQRRESGALIRRNIEIKSEIVAADEEERTGERALLNFGHTVGHAIENAAGYGVYFHGEAISIGIAAAAFLSMEKAGLSLEDHDAILRRLRQFRLPVSLPREIATEAILAALATDKKFAGGRIHFVLTGAIGSAFVSPDVSREDIRGAIEHVRAE